MSLENGETAHQCNRLRFNKNKNLYGSRKHFNFITRLYSIDLFTVFGKLFWDSFHHEIKFYFLGNIVAYVLKFGKCGKIIAIFDQNSI